jgi:hypothetical protein
MDDMQRLTLREEKERKTRLVITRSPFPHFQNTNARKGGERRREEYKYAFKDGKKLVG